MFKKQLIMNFTKINQLRHFISQHKSNEPFTIVVEGNIGSGKTSFLNYFKENNNIKTITEPVELWRNMKGHNLLDLMYKDPKQWGFTFQTYVQLTMLQIHECRINSPVKMMERSIYSARYCFLENLYQSGLMANASKTVLDEWFHWITERPSLKCDLIVYLQTKPEICLERIKKRCRNEEKCVPLEYLEKLHVLHEKWLLGKSEFSVPAPVLVFNANKGLSDMLIDYQACEAQLKTEFGRVGCM